MCERNPDYFLLRNTPQLYILEVLAPVISGIKDWRLGALLKVSGHAELLIRVSAMTARPKPITNRISMEIKRERPFFRSATFKKKESSDEDGSLMLPAYNSPGESRPRTHALALLPSALRWTSIGPRKPDDFSSRP